MYALLRSKATAYKELEVWLQYHVAKLRSSQHIYYSPLFPRILEVNTSHILSPTGQKLGMAHILLPLGYHSVQSNLISCTLVQIHDTALHIHNNNIICD